MKIGFSFGRCIRDIVLGKVKIDDVLLIIGRTRMPTEDDCKWVINEYMTRSGYLGGLDEAKCMEVGLALYNSRRIIEPRGVGAHAFQAPHDCVWMDLFPTVVDEPNESVTAAWEQYRMLIGLTAQLPEVDEEALKHRKVEVMPPILDTVPAKKKRGRKSKAEKEAEAERKRALDILAALIV